MHHNTGTPGTDASLQMPYVDEEGSEQVVDNMDVSLLLLMSLELTPNGRLAINHIYPNLFHMALDFLNIPGMFFLH